MAAIASIAQLIMGKMQQNQATRSKGDVENTKQVQDLMSTFIQKGATPQEAQAVAMKMVGNYKPLEKSQPWLMQNEQGQNTGMPNIANIWGDLGARLNTPQWQGPGQMTSKDPMSYQKLENEKTQSEIEKNKAAANRDNRYTGPGGAGADSKDNALKIAAIKMVLGNAYDGTEEVTPEQQQAINANYILLKTLGPNAVIPPVANKPEEAKKEDGLLQQFMGLFEGKSDADRAAAKKGGAAAAPAGDLITVWDKNGTKGTIPRANWTKAKTMGFTTTAPKAKTIKKK